MSQSSKRKNDSVVETFKDIIPLTFGEEIGNAASHGAAALLTLFILPYAAVHSFNNGGTLESISVSVYVISIFMMFISSTIYHSMQNNTSHKYILRIIDHSMIYVAISGTYTPVFEIIGKPFVPVLELLQIPEAHEASQTILIGFADMFLPSILIEGVQNDVTRFVIGALSISQLVYLSEVGGVILGSKIPVSISKLFMIFLIRTIITLPIIALLAHLFIG
jgi:nucleoside recognition membrane protein YjiH